MSEASNEVLDVQPVVPQDLQDQVNAIKALSLVHTLLNRGMFQISEAQKVDQSIAFVAVLHKNLTEAALAHPEVNSVPELKALKENQ